MSPKIHSTFWSDDDTGSLPVDQKLAFLWLITNQATNNIGFVAVSRRGFTHDTGAPFDTLEGLLKALPRAFVTELVDGRLHIWIRHFIRHQWTPGELSRKSNIFRHLVSLAAQLPEQFRQALSCEYPALARGLSDMMNGEKSQEWASKGLQAPRAEQSRAENSRAEQNVLEGGAGETAEAPSLAEVEAWAATWPGEPATGAPPIDPDWLRDWFAFRDNSRTSGWDRFRDWRRLAISDWRKQFRAWPAKKAGGGSGGPGARTPAGGSGVWAMKQRVEAVRKAIAEHVANRNSSAYVVDAAVTPELAAELKKLREEESEIERRLAGQ